jgi:hypothetical protein
VQKTAAAPGYNPRADARAVLKAMKQRRFGAKQAPAKA